MSTQTVAEFISDLKYDNLPANVIAQAKIAIRDHIGVMLAAYQDEAVNAARNFAINMGGRGESTLHGTKDKVPCNLAAMVGAIMARTLDMDDGSYRKFGHLAHAGGVVVPSCLAVAERQKSTGKALIEAAVSGYEVDLRAGWVVALWKMFAPAGMAGTYGSAALAAKLLSLDTAKTRDALGIAEAHCLWPSRAKQFTETAMTKEAAGWGAMTGVSAALLALAGFNGPKTLFDIDEVSREPLATLGKEWEIMNLYFKPYSSCRATHTPLDGVFELLKINKLNAGDVVKIEIGISNFLATAMANYRPENIWQAQFSIPFVVGAALSVGAVTPAQFTPENLINQDILSQADKVTLLADEDINSLAVDRGLRAARVKFITKDGNQYEVIKEVALGAPENPLSEQELNDKFIDLATEALGTDKANTLNQYLLTLEDIDDINSIISLMRLI